MTLPPFRLPTSDSLVRAPGVALVGTGQAGLRVRQACEELRLACLVAPPVAADAVVEQAMAAGCRALHPGESDVRAQLELAIACGRAGLTFVGPRPALIEAMLDGEAIRLLMREAGVPLAEGGAAGPRVRLPVLADSLGSLRCLPAWDQIHPGLVRAPVAWLTPEQRAYLGQLARQAPADHGLVGRDSLDFQANGNRLGFTTMRPGLDGSEALGEALTGVDPVVEQLRLAAGERLRVRQAALAPRGHALQWRLFPLEDAGFSGGPGLRLDRPLEASGEARLLAWGRRPEEARRRGRRGLHELLGEAASEAMLAGIGPP